ncbi:MAG: FtsX-like permease family protein [Candidatus Heimdallarchaeum aukensis]|uniref:FtsX-like permease family protein n=1 Tax=Candidatus Heimdallarchaeum aukensis TaxID=2876573 RepID=A0A9Y1FLE1_9ARCH|nr:MAG: FtsX-like permease family protein [Candidatus Heimdallarchaeum aukensis]
MLSFSVLFFFHNKKRTYQAILVLSLSLVIYISTTLLVRGYSSNLSGMANIIAPSDEYIIIEKEKSLSESRIENQTIDFLHDYAEKTPNIKAIVAYKYVPIIIEGENGRIKETYLRLLNFTYFNSYYPREYVYSFENPGSDELILGRYLASLLSADKNSVVDVYLPTINFNTSLVISNIITNSDEFELEIIASFNSILNSHFDYFSFVEIKIKDPSTISAIQEDIKEKYPELDVISEKQTQEFIIYGTNDIIQTLTLLQSLFFILMLVSITYSIYTLVKESEKEIFILRSIGATNLNIISLFLLQSLYIGIISAFLALIGGFLFIVSIVSAVTAFSHLPYISVTIYSKLIVIIFGFSIGLSILSGIIPSFLASKIRLLKEDEIVV